MLINPPCGTEDVCMSRYAWNSLHLHTSNEPSLRGRGNDSALKSMKSKFYFPYLCHSVSISHDISLMPDEEHPVMEAISHNYLILFEGAHEGHCFCILLLPDGTAAAEQAVHPFKSVAIYLSGSSGRRHEWGTRMFQGKKFLFRYSMDERSFYHLLLMDYSTGPGTIESLPHPTLSIRTQFLEYQRSQVKQVRTGEISETECGLWTCIACILALHMQPVIVNLSIQLKACICYDYTGRQ